MYGWRARIGHVAPSRGDTLVYEFYKMFPEGFMMLNTTGTVRQLVDNDFEKQLQRIEEAVQDLVDNNCDSIIFSGSPLYPASFRHRSRNGAEADGEIRRAGGRRTDSGGRGVKGNENQKARCRHAL